MLKSWAEAEWFTSRPEVPQSLTLTVFKVSGETNTDDLSPAPDAWSRPDIPLHAVAMLKNARPGINPDEPGKVGPLKQLDALKAKGHLVAYVGDVVGTGSSRKSATNSVLWFTGEDIPFVPNKRFGGVCLGSKIAPIFYNTMEDAGALPIELDVNGMEMGDVIELRPYEGKALKNGKVIAEFKVKSDVIFDEVRAGGRIPLIIGRGLTAKAREALGLPASTTFRLPAIPKDTGKGFSLAQKMVGKACGVAGIRPGTYCEPRMTTVGSQDTTGPMTRDELKDLACLQFSADMVMQSFCHTAPYPKPVDVKTHRELPPFITNRGGVSLKPGDGVIHSWLNRLLLPDTVGTGGDSHTRFPIGISFPAGSGLVAFAAATGVMPLDMPESVLVRFKGELQPGVTLRDLVNAIPYYAIQQGLLTVEKKGKKNIFSGRILEIEGLPKLKVEQAFELSDASAERSAAGCTVRLDKEPIIEYMTSNITLMKWMIANGYEHRETLENRIRAMQAWIAKPELLAPDADAEYAAVIEIDLADVKEPLVACPNDPDDVKLLSAVAGDKIDEVFIGSCMTNIGHFRAAGKLLDGKTRPPHPALDRPAHQDGRVRPHPGGLLRHPRPHRRPHGDARLLAVHGQPGPDPQGQHGHVHLHPQLPQPPGPRHPRLPGLRGTGRHLRPARQDPHRGRVHGPDRHRRPEVRGHLPLHELRPDRGLPRDRRHRPGVVNSPQMNTDETEPIRVHLCSSVAINFFCASLINS